jgi:hypothetical protein
MQAFLMLASVLALASMCVSIFLAFQSPRFVAGLAAIIVEAILPSILKAIKPRNLTKAEIEKIVQGGSPFDNRPSGHGGSN